MDFARMTAEDVLTALPPGDEDSRWELKSASYLTPQKRSDLKSELGKQVSAFANSGGGYLVFGVSKERNLEPCEMAVGREPMKDFLATMVEQSVEHPIRHFHIHQVGFAGDTSNAIFVVELEDSPAAPHQAKAEKIYYYRIDGHSKPAPHFHLELLRHRFTKSVIEIESIEQNLQVPTVKDGTATFGLKLFVTITNRSFQSTTHWGFHLKTCHEDYRWKTGLAPQEYLTNGVCIHSTKVLLPSERFRQTIDVMGSDQGWGFPTGLVESCCLTITPVSQNHVGETWRCGVPFHDMMRLRREWDDQAESR